MVGIFHEWKFESSRLRFYGVIWMNVIISANDNYFVATKVMIISFLQNNNFEHHDIYFLYNEMNTTYIKNIKKSIEKKYDVSFIPVYIGVKEFVDFPVSHHFSIETYFRFLVGDILPQNESRALWLDVDMIVLRSLKSFYYQDFEGKSLVVCKSINKNPQEILNKLGCPKMAVYFNAGTILFNLDRVRTKKLIDYKNYFENNRQNITWLDQDILNGMYALDIKINDYKKYNRQFFNEEVFSENDMIEIENDTVILHYIGSLKPWNKNYTNQCAEYWTHYFKLSFSRYELFFLRVLRKFKRLICTR